MRLQLALHAVLISAALGTLLQERTWSGGTAISESKGQAPSSSPSPMSELHTRDLVDLAIAASGAAVSLGFLGVTGQYYSKTWGRRDLGPENDATHMPYLAVSGLSTHVPGPLQKRTDYYPLYIGSMSVFLSAGGVLNNAIAHVKLKQVFGKQKPGTGQPPHRRRRHLAQTPPEESASPLHERGKMEVIASSTWLPKTIELSAGTVSMASFPFSLLNVLAIGRKPSTPAHSGGGGGK